MKAAMVMLLCLTVILATVAGNEESCEPGTTFKRGCNECSCTSSGRPACTKKACPPGILRPGRAARALSRLPSNLNGFSACETEKLTSYKDDTVKSIKCAFASMRRPVACNSLFVLRVPSHLIGEKPHLKSVLLVSQQGEGGTVTERLGCSPPTMVNRAQSPADSLRIFTSGNRVGRCRWSVDFLGDLSFTPPFNSGVTPYLPHVTLIGSEDLADGVALECNDGGTGIPRENPLASGIVQHDPHMRKYGSEPAGDRVQIAVVGGERPIHRPTAVPLPG
ncbi:hypothetical protein PR048_021391 [Dryococelus australis]|uniref:Pacifastin domain-containing protein n=1 Tax=Dryococelus australis TaxID=614101 RepID=A0ABQ9GY43_9NEOP|nr:hypothetical protein PR048_021391 [Dryococelus australis]